MLKDCTNCIFYSPYAQFKQKQNNCLHMKNKKVIVDTTKTCSSLLISEKRMNEYRITMEEREREIEQRKIAEDEKKVAIQKQKAKAYVELKDMCGQRGLVFEGIATGVFLMTKHEKWYVEANERNISLFHRNAKGNTFEYHHQRDFLFSGVDAIIDYVLGHEKHVAFSRKTAWLKE